MSEPSDRGAAFAGLARAVIVRFLSQNGAALPEDGGIDRLTRTLWRIVEERGPRAPVAGCGAPIPEMGASEVEPLVERLLSGIGPRTAALETAARQLVKGCLQPEFADCRQTYRQAGAGGVCRRQQLSRALERVCGSHCVDCPFWTSLDGDAHRKLLRDAFGPERAALFDGHPSVFLPPDYRALRRFVGEWAARRSP